MTGVLFSDGFSHGVLFPGGFFFTRVLFPRGFCDGGLFTRGIYFLGAFVTGILFPGNFFLVAIFRRAFFPENLFGLCKIAYALIELFVENYNEFHLSNSNIFQKFTIIEKRFLRIDKKYL